ncbi:MAG TPA: preprotein translocase subunit YajC [Longimicrobiaceae bacterium]
MTINSVVLAQAAGGGMSVVFFWVFTIVIIYFLFIMPQRKEQKRHRELLASLKPGMEVVTMGGVVGEIITIKDELVTLKSGDSRLVVERARVTRLLNPPAATK